MVSDAGGGLRTDLWELDDRRRAEVLTDRLESNFYARCPPERRPARLRPLNNHDKGKDKDTAGVIDPGNGKADDNDNDNDEKGLGALEAGAALPDLENANENANNVKGQTREPQYDSSQIGRAHV